MWPLVADRANRDAFRRLVLKLKEIDKPITE